MKSLMNVLFVSNKDVMKLEGLYSNKDVLKLENHVEIFKPL